MRNFLQSLSPRTEFAVVIVGAFGLFIVTSLCMAFHPTASPQHSAGGLWLLAFHETVVNSAPVQMTVSGRLQSFGDSGILSK